MWQDSSRLLGRRCIRCSLSHISILRRRRSRNRRRKEEKVEFMSHRCLLEAKKRANERASLFLSLPLSNKRPLAPPFPSLLSPPSLFTSWLLGLPQVYVPSRIADILPPPGKSSIRMFVICATFLYLRMLIAVTYPHHAGTHILSSVMQICQGPLCRAYKQESCFERDIYLKGEL